MTEGPRRRFLGKTHSLAERVRTYWTDEALEVDRLDNYEIRRRRVFFDEVLLVTLHTTRGVMSSLVPLILALLFALLAAVSSSEPDVSRVFWIGAALFTVLAVGLALAPVRVVTVFGRRTRTRMHFRMGEARARRVYSEICRAAADAQRALAQRLSAEAPEPTLPFPLPLSGSELLPPPPARFEE